MKYSSSSIIIDSKDLKSSRSDENYENDVNLSIIAEHPLATVVQNHWILQALPNRMKSPHILPSLHQIPGNNQESRRRSKTLQTPDMKTYPTYQQNNIPQKMNQEKQSFLDYVSVQMQQMRQLEICNANQDFQKEQNTFETTEKIRDYFHQKYNHNSGYDYSEFYPQQSAQPQKLSDTHSISEQNKQFQKQSQHVKTRSYTLNEQNNSEDQQWEQKQLQLIFEGYQNDLRTCMRRQGGQKNQTQNSKREVNSYCIDRYQPISTQTDLKPNYKSNQNGLKACHLVNKNALFNLQLQNKSSAQRGYNINQQSQKAQNSLGYNQRSQNDFGQKLRLQNSLGQNSQLSNSLLNKGQYNIKQTSFIDSAENNKSYSLLYPLSNRILSSRGISSFSVHDKINI